MQTMIIHLQLELSTHTFTVQPIVQLRSHQIWPLYEILTKVHQSSKNLKIYSLDWLHCISYIKN